MHFILLAMMGKRCIDETAVEKYLGNPVDIVALKGYGELIFQRNPIPYVQHLLVEVSASVVAEKIEAKVFGILGL